MIGAELQVEIDIQTVLFEFVGGLGIFLLGIKYMGDGLQKSAGDGLRDILDKFTSNPFLGVLAGIIVTVLIQSSSGTTVLTIGLVNAGFMTRSEEHTSELQSRGHLVCRLLLAK